METETLVWYLTQGKKFGEVAEAENAVEEFAGNFTTSLSKNEADGFQDRIASARGFAESGQLQEAVLKTLSLLADVVERMR